MDEKTARAEMRQWEERLDALEKERQAIAQILTGYRSWLDVSVIGTIRVSRPPSEIKNVPQKNSPEGSINTRQAVLRALRESNGVEMHVRDILAAARGIGAVVNHDHPENIMDLTLHGLKKSHPEVQKVGRRTWAWVVQPPMPISPDTEQAESLSIVSPSE